MFYFYLSLYLVSIIICRHIIKTIKTYKIDCKWNIITINMINNIMIILYFLMLITIKFSVLK